MKLVMIIAVPLWSWLVLGAVFGLVLAFAAKVFAVEKDPREEAIAGCLPGANCGGCGFPGCGGYAAAVAAGKAPANCCAAGGAAVAAKIGEIMGVKAEASVKIAGPGQVHRRRPAAKRKFEYVGIHDCVAASKLPGGGPAGCSYGCLGFGSCE